MDNYGLVDALVSRTVNLFYILMCSKSFTLDFTIWLIDCLFIFHPDMCDIGEDQLVLYAQMANLVKLVLPAIEINLKEITENFSKARLQ